jgi:hypothetical protein
MSDEEEDQEESVLHIWLGGGSPSIENVLDAAERSRAANAYYKKNTNRAYRESQPSDETPLSDIDAISGAALPVNNTIELAVAILRRSNNQRMNERTRQLLTPGLVVGIYDAEKAHKSTDRRIADFFGRGKSVGKGQITKGAYTDRRNFYAVEFSQYLRTLQMRASGNFRKDIQDDAIHDFIATGYLAFHIWWNSDKYPEREPEDTLRFAIGLYTNARNIINRAGRTFNRNNEIPEETPVMRFSDIAPILERGSSGDRRILSYINMVYDSR